VTVRAFAVEEAAARLAAEGGGYEVVHAAPGLELGVYVLVAPAPDAQSPHEDDEVYAVLSGSGVLRVDGQPLPVAQGDAVFVPAGAEHRFEEYEDLRLLVVFTPRAAEAAPLRRSYA
jgi:mannose-6-phosphate isomerase-like protein (cupin superfamily)